MLFFRLARTGKESFEQTENGSLLQNRICNRSHIYYPFGGFYHELAALAYSGIPIADVLKTGTFNTAEFMGKQGQIGSLEPNAQADILVCEGNAFSDIYALGKVKAVYKKGQRIV